MTSIEVRARKFMHRLLLAAACGPFALQAAAAQPDDHYVPRSGQAGKDVVWVPTPQPVVDRMLEMAKLSKKDLLIDLGAGDGRIAITAAKRYGARAIGIEYNPDMVALAQREVVRHGVQRRVKIVEGDIFKSDFTRASVVSAYLLPELNLRLRPILLAMAPGTRIVTHDYDMGDWPPDDSAKVGSDRAFFWVVPAHVAGEWRVQVGKQVHQLTLRQRYQQLEGFVVLGPDRTGLFEPQISGANLSFGVNDRNGVRHQFVARVRGDTMSGVRRTGDAEVPFRATRSRSGK